MEKLKIMTKFSLIVAKHKLIIFLTIFVCIVLSGCDKKIPMNEIGKLNHFAAPLETKIKINFNNKITDSMHIRTHVPNVFGKSDQIDTVLTGNFTETILTINLAIPNYFTIDIGDTRNNIFLIPGIDSEMNIDPTLEENNIVNRNLTYNSIENYYQSKYDLLGVKYQISGAFQLLMNADLNQASIFLDSTDVIQNKNLLAFKDILPEWFYTYESKNIEFMSMGYKLAVAFQLLRAKHISLEDIQLRALLDNFNSSNESDLITSSYFSLITKVAMLKYCTEGCFEQDEPVNHKGIAITKYLHKIENDEIREAIASNLLIGYYRASRILPDSIIQVYKSYSDNSKFKDFIDTYKTKSIINEVLPYTYLKDTYDEFQSLGKYKGKVLLLNFWFVGCKPCLLEIPYENVLVKEMENSPFELINICMNTPEDSWKSYITKNNLTGVNLYANKNWSAKIVKNYNIGSYPRYMLVDTNGVVIDDKSIRPSNPKLAQIIKNKL